VEEIQKCPEIKKFVEKPKFNQTEVRPMIETFINKFMMGQENTSVVNIRRNNASHVVLTTSSYCESIRGEHPESVMSYVIKGSKITQQCPLCKGKKNKARTHTLMNTNLIKLLKQ
jgi:hypothetical protein